MEVERANEIVARYPNTISMAHLRGMDAAWRAARGLPLLPEPEGPRLIVDDWLHDRPASPHARSGTREERDPAGLAEDLPPAARAGALAAEAGAIVGAQEAAGRTRAAADRTVLLASSLARATADAHEPLQRLRTVLHEVYGEHSPAAEASFRRVCLEEGVERAVRTLRADPRALLPHPQPRTLPGGVRARESAAGVAAESAPFVARLDHVLRETARHLGDERSALDPITAGRRLRDVLPGQQRAAAEAQESARQLASGLPRLRAAWLELTPAEQASVRRALPDVDRVLGAPARARNRGGPEL